MDVTGTFVIITAVIFMVFITEFRDFFIKITKIRGVKLWVPLFWMSWVVEVYFNFLHYGFLWFHAALIEDLLYFSSFFSSNYSIYIIKIIFLFMLGIIPLIGLYWRANFKFGYQFIRRTKVKQHPVAHRAYILLWIIMSILVAIK